MTKEPKTPDTKAHEVRITLRVRNMEGRPGGDYARAVFAAGYGVEAGEDNKAKVALSLGGLIVITLREDGKTAEAARSAALHRILKHMPKEVSVVSD